MVETIGFIGLGDLGRPVATNLLEAGYRLRVYNRTAHKADSLVARGAERVLRPAEAIVADGVVVTLLWDDASVEGVVRSDGFLEKLGRGGVHVSMSTVSPEGSRTLAAIHAAHGSHFVEAPIFGRPEAAVAKKLWIPYAGPHAAKARVRALLEAMGAQGLFDFGEQIGAATTVKLVGNFLIISAAASLTEGLSLAEQSGVDAKAVLDMLTETLFPAPIYRTYGRTVVEGSSIIAQSPIPTKDLGLFTKTAQAVGSPMQLASLLLDLRKSQT